MTEIQFTTEELNREEWRPVVGFENIYAVSDLGRIRRVKPEGSIRVGKILNPFPNRRGYMRINLYWGPRRKKTTYCHIAVMRAFAGPCPEGHEVNHKDTDKSNNRLSNLEYMTHMENITHAVSLGRIQSGDAHYSRRTPERTARGDRHGTRRHPEIVRRGSQSHYAKLNEDNVREIKALLAQGFTRKSIGERFGVSPDTIGCIHRGETWAHVRME